MPNTREKLIELMEQVYYCSIEEMADHLITNGVTIQEWIPVAERLPEDICPVLVVLEWINIPFMSWYQDEKWWTVGAGTRDITQKVTHWMPLPEPPQTNIK